MSYYRELKYLNKFYGLCLLFFWALPALPN